MPYTEFHYTPTGTGVISGKEVLEQTEDAINDLGGQISGDVQTAIDTANNALNTANTASADAQNAVNTANTAYTAATNAQNTANAAQTTASNALTAAQNAQNDVNALGNRVTTAENNISQNTSDISGLTTRMGTAEGNITNLQNDVITAQGTATSAQNTATLARGQAYVTRYTATSVSDNSTVAYSDLNNTDNIKIGDFILDVNGKLYAITAVDGVNETVSVTTPLTQLAIDSDVVHKSGNETISGTKTFLDVPIPFKSSTAELGVTGGNTKVIFTDKNLLNLAGITFGNYGSSKLSYCRFHIYDKDSNNQEIENYIEFSYVNNNNFAYFRPNKLNFVTLGTINNRWSKVYADEYYYGSNSVEFSQKFVTTDTAQTISGNKTFSDTLTIYNSDDTVTPKGLIIRNAQWSMGESGATTVSSIDFLDKNYLRPASVTASKGLYGQSYLRFSVRTKDSQNTTYAEEIYYDIDTSGNVEFRSWHDNIISLGTSAYKWKDVQTKLINGLEPSALGMPSGNANDVIDISSYITDLSGTVNLYTPPANGYLTFTFSSGAQVQIYPTTGGGLASKWTAGSGSGIIRGFIPVLKNVEMKISVNATTMNSFYFIPCQGNV